MLLRDCTPNPRQDPRFGVIMNVGNRDYYLRRAQECLQSSMHGPSQVQMAVALLSLVLAEDARSSGEAAHV